MSPEKDKGEKEDVVKIQYSDGTYEIRRGDKKAIQEEALEAEDAIRDRRGQ